MTTTDLAGLIEKLESASEGSAELDRAIAPFAGWQWVEEDYDLDGVICTWRGFLNPAVARSKRQGHEMPQWSRSLDAALTLVPEGWMLEHLGDDAHGTPGSLTIFGAACDLTNGDFERVQQGQAKTRPLALSIAALKARSQS